MSQQNMEPKGGSGESLSHPDLSPTALREVPVQQVSPRHLLGLECSGGRRWQLCLLG